MDIYTKIPRNRINPNTINAKRTTIFQKKKHCPCITINSDDNTYLDNNGAWVSNVKNAHVMTLEEAYYKTVDMPLTYNIEYLLIKISTK